MAKKLTKLSLPLVLLAFLGCQQGLQQTAQVLTGKTMGTTYSIKFYSDKEHSSQILYTQVENILQEINQLMSTYIPDSEINLLGKAEEKKWIPLHPKFAIVLKKAIAIGEKSEGSYDVTIAPLVNLWGFGPKKSSIIPPKEEIINVKNQIGHQQLKLKEESGQFLLWKENQQVSFDFSSIAKGYAVDQLAELLQKKGINRYMIEIGGEIVTKGHKAGGYPWKIAIERPVSHTREVGKVLDLSNLAIATSGDYRNYFEKDGQRFSHTIDPLTGYPITHKVASVTVIAPSCMDADAWATAMMVMGDRRGLEIAENEKLAVYFIIKTNKGFKEVYSSAFKTLLTAE